MKRVVAALLALAFTAAIVLPFTTIRADTPKAQSLRYSRGHGALRVVFHIHDEPCAPSILKALEVQDGEFYRRATVDFVDVTREACWLTVIGDGAVLIEAPSIGATYSVPAAGFRPEQRA